MPAPRKSKSGTVAAAPAPAAGDPARIFLVFGTDDLSATRKADEIVARLCPPEEQAFGLECLAPESGANSETVCAVLRDTQQALLTPPFLGGGKTVYLRNAPFFNPLTEPGKFAEVKAEVERLVDLLRKGLPRGVAFVVLTDGVNKSTAFFKLFQAGGETHGFDRPERERDAEVDFIPQVEKLLAARNLAMPSEVFAAFLDRTGYNLRQVASEIEKLALFLDTRRTVTSADLALMVAPVREGQFYEFADTFCRGDLGDTLQTLHRLFEQRINPIPLLVNLQDRLRQLFVLADCLRRGWARVSGGDWPKVSWMPPPEGEALLAALEKDPRKGNPYAVAKMAAQARRYPPARWYRWLNATVDAQAAMTGGEAVEPEVALELLVLRTLGEWAVEAKPAKTSAGSGAARD